MKAEPNFDFFWVKDIAGLEALAQDLLNEPYISVDTETAGWQTGNERLCLIQIGIPSKRTVALVDTVVLDTLAPLEKVICQEAPLLIAHNASFEERQFLRYELKMKGVRDTLTMARKLRPDLPNHTLRTCCKLLLKVELSKEEQTSDWSVRPLTDRQVAYARLDAEVAIQLYTYLEELERRVQKDLGEDIEGLMREMLKVTEQRIKLTESIAHELAYLNARRDALYDTIRQKLINGEPEYDGALGCCNIKKIKRTEINAQKVREKFPEIADQLIQEHVDRKRFEAVTKELGLPKSAIELVLDTIGYTDRMTLSIKDDAGEVL